MRLLILLVHNGVLCGAGAGAQASVRVLSHILIGFLGCRGARSVNGFRDVVCGVLRGFPVRCQETNVVGKSVTQLRTLAVFIVTIVFFLMC